MALLMNITSSNDLKSLPSTFRTPLFIESVSRPRNIKRQKSPTSTKSRKKHFMKKAQAEAPAPLLGVSGISSTSSTTVCLIKAVISGKFLNKIFCCPQIKQSMEV